MDFKQLLSFVTVVNSHSFSKAAEKLYISQPSISAHIRSLEAEMGTVLLDRTTKSVELTEKGQEFYEYAQDILRMKDRMINSCQSSAKKVIHIGASTIPSAYFLPDLVCSYTRFNPDVSFFLNHGDSTRILSGLVDGIYDVGFVGMKKDIPGLVYQPVCEDRMVLIAPNTEEYAPSLSLKELLTKPMILREEGSASGALVERMLYYTGLKKEDMQVFANCDDTEAIKNMVANGGGIACISEKATKEFDVMGLIQVFDLPDEISTRFLYMVWRDKDIKPFVDHFMEYAKHYEQ